ncbi:MAG: cell wall-binding repeat-containing protein [Ilumatobacter sp.]|nr:cell wall-binding repeat-containing protein [Ilumatobacter sp.]
MPGPSGLTASSLTGGIPLTTRTWRAKRRIGAAALVALIGSTLAFASSATAITGAGVAESARLSGENRAATAVDMYLDATEGWNAAAGTFDVTIVNGNNFPDGLTASIYADPILLVNADSIPAETAAALAAVEAGGGDVGTITVVGGTSVVSSSVLEQLDALNGAQPAVRVAGDDRYLTSTAVATHALDGNTTCDMILATGENFPDALAAGPLAIAADAPILLNTGASLLAPVKAVIAGGLTEPGTGAFVNCSVAGTATVHIIGGVDVVPASIDAELQSMGVNVNRIAGANRAETAIAVATAVGVPTTHLTLVNGYGFADALAAGPLAASNGSVLVLVNEDSIPAATAAFHVAACVSLVGDPQVVAMGGTAVISDAVLAAADAAATCSVPTYTATLSASSNTQSVYHSTTTGVVGTEGITFTSVAGSASDGAAGNTWTITVGYGAATVPSSAVANTTDQTLAITLAGALAGGGSQAAIAAEINGLAAASALFTAAPNAATGAPIAYGATAIVVGKAVAAAQANPVGSTVVGSTTQQLVFTFSANVDDTAATTGGDVLDGTNITIGGVVLATVAQAPLAATPGGASVYTFTATTETAAAVHALAEAVVVTGFATSNGVAVSNTGAVLTAAS